MQHALSRPSLRLSAVAPRASRLAVALGLIVSAGVLAQPTARGVSALMVWALVQALLVGVRGELAAMEADRAAGRRTLAVILGRTRTVRLVRIVSVEALVFALAAVATGVFSPAAAVLAGAAAFATTRDLNAGR